MLAGAYSKQYQTLQQEHVHNLKTSTYDTKVDVLARAKKLSHDTNKRRKAQAYKLKIEAFKEEKRRKEILSKRHEEQKVATERFQRSHISHSRPSSSKSFRYASTIDDALKLVRGSPSPSRQSSFIHHGGRTSPLPAGNYPSDPLHRPYVSKPKSRHLRPSSPSSPKSQVHAEMKDKSLRNWNDSKSLFEQQLEQHQLLLLDQQQKSLYEFNEAISNEIAKDDKVNGTDDRDDTVYIQSESLSSVDSLDDSLNSNNKPQEESIDNNILAHNLCYPVSAGNGAKGSFYLETNSLNHSEKTGSHFNSSRSHIQPSYSDIPMKSTSVSYMSQSNSLVNTVPVSSVKPMFVLTGNLLQANVAPVNNASQYTNDTDRPMSHVKTWVEPEKTEGVATNIPSSNIKTSSLSTASTYDIITPQVKPRTIFNTNSAPVASTNSCTKNVHCTTAPGISNINSSSASHNNDTTIVTNSSKGISNTVTNGSRTVEISVHDENVGTDLSKAPNGSILTGTLHLVNGKLMSNLEERPKVQSKFPASYTSPVENTSYFRAVENTSYSRQAETTSYSRPVETTSYYKPVETTSYSRPVDTTSYYKPVETTSYSRPVSVNVLNRTDSTENIVGILKRSTSNNNIRDMRDSIEITKLKKQISQDSKVRPKSSKKSVRFADLSDDEEETDIFMSSFSGYDSTKKLNLKNAKGGTGKLRPSSARVVSKMGKVPPSAPKPPRSSSAGIMRSVSKPKAAAHIITQEPRQTEQSEAYYKNLQSDLEKKVTIVNNNFMGKVTSSSKQQVETNGNNSVQMYTGKYQPSSTQSVQLKMTDASKYVTAPTSSISLPQTPSYNYNNQPVFDENGLRIDRTPTDDEINMLWETVRTCLHPSDEERSQSSQAQSDSILASRQKAKISSTIIDGAALGSVGRPTRVGSAYQQRTISKTYQIRHAQQPSPNGYLKKYGLLQQRRQQEKANNQTTANIRENMMPQISQSNTSPNKKEEVTDSLSMFMMAEQLANRAVSENHIQQAMDDLHARQNAINNKSKVPSALSLEEQHLIESLDRLNDKLKIAESRYPQATQQASHQTIATTTVSNTNQPTSGFRGRRPITAHQRRHTDGVRTDYLIRAASAHSTSSQRQYR